MKEAPIAKDMRPLEKDQTAFLGEMQKKYGDIFQRNKNFELFHPKHVEHILFKHEDNYQRHPSLVNLFKPVFGDDIIIVTNDNKQWSYDRKISEPSFDPHVYFDQYIKKVIEISNCFFDGWEDQLKSGSKIINIPFEIDHLIVNIVHQTIIFKIEADPKKIVEYINIALKNTADLANPFLPKQVLYELSKKQKDVIQELTQLRDHIVQARIQKKQDFDDLLGSYLEDYDQNNPNELILKHIARNILALDLAGYVTTAATLHWLFILLHQHPKIENAITEESRSVNLQNYSDLTKLTHIQAMIFEALRLYPPFFVILRQSIKEDELLGYHIPQQAGISLNTYYIHRHPDYWENPDQFNPERFIKKPLGQDFPYAYFPFGAGKRRCLGRNFAMLEMTVILALFVKRFRLSLPSDKKLEYDYSRITITPSIKEMTLHKKLPK